MCVGLRQRLTSGMCFTSKHCARVHRFIQWPTAFKASHQRRIAQALLSRPFGGGFSVAFEGNQPISAHIIVLFQRGGPSAVVRRIWSALVWIAVQGMRWGRAFSHIAKEVIEAVTPFIADDNPASAVSKVFLMGRVVTPTFRANPCAISLRCAFSSSVTVPCLWSHNRSLAQLCV